MTGFLPIAIVLMGAAAVAGVAWYVFTIAGEVTYVTLADGRRQERSLPVLFKALLPFVGNAPYTAPSIDNLFLEETKQLRN